MEAEYGREGGDGAHIQWLKQQEMEIIWTRVGLERRKGAEVVDNLEGRDEREEKPGAPDEMRWGLRTWHCCRKQIGML